jgi:hypothetical protein
MVPKARDRARSLELIIRAAAAEERLLGRRLERIAQAQAKARADAAPLRPVLAPQPQEGSSDR